jgi:hypothetical protein
LVQHRQRPSAIGGRHPNSKPAVNAQVLAHIHQHRGTHQPLNSQNTTITVAPVAGDPAKSTAVGRNGSAGPATAPPGSARVR